MLAGGRDRADWVRNLRVCPAVRVGIGRDGPVQAATARVVEAGTDEDARARRLIVDKYQAPGSRDLESWGRSALLVAVDRGQGPAAGTSRDMTT